MAFALHIAILLLVPPLLIGVVNRTKAIAAGRTGPPMLQAYYDLARLVRKGAVYSRTTTWVFRAGPIVSLSGVIAAGLLLPLVGAPSPLGFPGDVIVFAYLMGLGRFFTMAAALDTGSAFEGMGASREAAFSALVEPALFLTLAILCVPARSVSLAPALESLSFAGVGPAEQAVVIGVIVLFVVLLAESSRIPVDDPNTHLELTMVHEVMVLDHCGPDLAFIEYGAAVKLFVIGALCSHLVLPISGASGWQGPVLLLAGVTGVAIGVGIVESVMARLRLVRVPQLLIGTSVLAAIGLAVLFFRAVP